MPNQDNRDNQSQGPSVPRNTPAEQRRAAAERQEDSVDLSGLPNESAVPSNRDPNSPEMQSLKTQAEANRANQDKPDGMRVRISMRTSGLNEDHFVKQVWFDSGFVLVEANDGRKTAYPAQEVGSVVFGPANLAWD